VRGSVGIFILTDEGTLLYKSIGLLGKSDAQPSDQTIAAVLKDVPAVLLDDTSRREESSARPDSAVPAVPAAARDTPPLELMLLPMQRRSTSCSPV
jgi:hypothetical protein